MEQMKQTIFALVVVFFLALLLAGCGKQSTMSQSTTEASAPAPAMQQQPTQSAPATETTTITNPSSSTESTSSSSMGTSSASSSMSSSSSTSSDASSAMTQEVAGCTDTDGGKEYNMKGSLVDVRGVTDADRCSENENYPGRLYESYCKADGNHGRETYDCPSGKCSDGACVAADSSSMMQ